MAKWVKRNPRGFIHLYWMMLDKREGESSLFRSGCERTEDEARAAATRAQDDWHLFMYCMRSWSEETKAKVSGRRYTTRKQVESDGAGFVWTVTIVVKACLEGDALAAIERALAAPAKS